MFAAKGAMQIFNLEIGKKMKAHKMPDEEPIAYWTWANGSTLGIVTDKSIYHWTTEGALAATGRPRLRAEVATDTRAAFGSVVGQARLPRWPCLSATQSSMGRRSSDTASRRTATG